MNLAFDNTYIQLPEGLYSRQAPAPVAGPALIRANHGLARRLGLEPAWLESAEGVAMLAGNRLPAGAEPIALAYAGHQFGSFVAELGDGRAVLLGEIVGADGQRYDLQLKGSGQTPYSRMGDGRAPLGPVLREYVVSEAMHALGAPTSRALAAVATGEAVHRERAHPGAVLARVARSHIRIGTAQFLAARREWRTLEALLAHAMARHYPEAQAAPRPALALLDGVCQAQARLVAGWQWLGFIHGVMNTDNMLLCGETIDYGPCAFMDAYHPETVYSSIDLQGRYAYRNQPGIAQWNLACLAQALLPLLDADEGQAVAAAKEVLDSFPGYFHAAWMAGLRAKLGLARAQPEDEALGRDFLDLLQATASDFTLAFRRLAELGGTAATENRAGGMPDDAAASVSSLFDFGEAFAPWLARWRKRLAQEARPGKAVQAAMLAVNPALIPRNHQVEAVIKRAEEEGDFTPFHALVAALENPYEYSRSLEPYTKPPRPEERVQRTFCGT